jgi:hypothetical protein
MRISHFRSAHINALNVQKAIATRVNPEHDLFCILVRSDVLNSKATLPEKDGSIMCRTLYFDTLPECVIFMRQNYVNAAFFKRVWGKNSKGDWIFNDVPIS